MYIRGYSQSINITEKQIQKGIQQEQLRNRIVKYRISRKTAGFKIKRSMKTRRNTKIKRSIKTMRNTKTRRSMKTRRNTMIKRRMKTRRNTKSRRNTKIKKTNNMMETREGDMKETFNTRNEMEFWKASHRRKNKSITGKSTCYVLTQKNQILEWKQGWKTQKNKYLE